MSIAKFKAWRKSAGRNTGVKKMSVKQTALRATAPWLGIASMVQLPIGAPNDGFAVQYFTGRSFAPVSTEQVGIFNVTFEPAT